tara:strand:+ start:606 stop:1637 length:1032 start_codon:yes stop_codon:yes gene_type:complete
MKKILVTGGNGFIGSHTVLKLLEADYEVVIFDNLSNSSLEVNNRIRSLTKKNFDFVEGDIRDKNLLKSIFKKFKIYAVIHLAGLKSGPESNLSPIEYYENNVVGSLNVLREMANYGIKKIVFSSSATVYGESALKKCKEDFILSPVSVYGKTKFIIENVLKDIKETQPDWRIFILRYFNPIGAHPSGMIGEDPQNIPSNLIPFLTQVAVGKRKELLVFGNTYDTPDGTGKRDYIHVQDLAAGHIAALQNLEKACKKNITVNLGTGHSYSVLEIIKAFETSTGKKIPFKVVDKRQGDIAELYADTSYAREILDWQADFNIFQMCEDSWRWQKMNPNGYEIKKLN